MTKKDYLAVSEKGPFRTVLVDPPYRTLDVQEIKAIPVRRLAYKECHLYLWCPGDRLLVASEIIEHWGFVYRDMLTCHTGHRPEQANDDPMFREVIEQLLFAVKGKERPMRTAQESFAKLPRKSRSGTPRIVRKIIEACSEGPYLELFAKRPADKWTCWEG